MLFWKLFFFLPRFGPFCFSNRVRNRDIDSERVVGAVYEPTIKPSHHSTTRSMKRHLINRAAIAKKQHKHSVKKAYSILSLSLQPFVNIHTQTHSTNQASFMVNGYFYFINSNAFKDLMRTKGFLGVCSPGAAMQQHLPAATDQK